MRNMFFYKLFRESKALFIFIIILCLGQYYFTKNEKNSIPWFYWAMYSSAENLPEAVNQFIIHIDGEEFDYLSLDYWGGIAVFKSIDKYKAIRDNSMRDPKTDLVYSKIDFLPEKAQSFILYKLLNKPFEVDSFPKWLHGYLEKKLNKKIEKIEVYNNWYKYINGKFQFSGGGDVFLQYESTP